MQNEKLYRTGGTYEGIVRPRYLRADLFLDIARLRVANRKLSQYGWRHHAWLEAKFLRNQAGPDGTTHSGNKTAHAAAFLADLIRLVTLVDEPGNTSRTARYFLHVYDAEPKYYLPFRNNSWAESITKSGSQDLKIEKLQDKSRTLRNLLGDMAKISIEAKITNLVLRPIYTTNRPIYYCILSRIDSFEARMDNDTFSLSPDRLVNSNPREAASHIAAYVAEQLHTKPDSPETKMPIEAEPPEEEELPATEVEL